MTAGTGIGYILSSRIGRQVETIDHTIRFLDFVKTGIRYNAQPIEELIAQAAVQYPVLTQLAICQEYIYQGLPFLTAWQSSVEWLVREKKADRAYTALLHDFGNGVGTTDLEGQLSHCDLYLARFNEQLSGAREQYKKKGRLYILLGGFAGLAAALLIL